MKLRTSRRLQPLAWGLGLALGGVTLGGVTLAALAENSPYYIGVSQALGYDSNLLLLSDGQPTPAGLKRSDVLSTTSVIAGLDQPISRQRVFGNLALRVNRYASNSEYDNQSYSGTLGVDWATVERLSGRLVGNVNRSLASFDQQGIGLVSAKNFEDSRALDFSANLGLVTQYSLYGTLGWREIENSLNLPALQSRDYNQLSYSAGVRWNPSSRSTFGIGLRQTDGEYPRFQPLPGGGFQADKFSRRDIDLTATLQPSGASTVSARISTGDTEYDLATQRDFSGVTGSVNWTWVATGKTRFNATLTRDTGVDSYATIVFNTPGTSDFSRVTTALNVSADYAATSKIMLTLGLGTSQRDLVRSLPAALGIPGQASKDRTNALNLGARWTPSRSVQVGCNAGVQRRNASGVLSSDFKSNTFSCYGQFTLQ